MIWIILFLGLVLRIFSINQSFWLDEATSATVAKHLSFTDIISKFSPGDFHPPLYYLTLKLWTLPFGVNEFSARSLSIVAALATIYFTYLIGKTYFEKNTGLMAAILLAVAPLHIYYSQEARMYSLQTLFVTMSVYFFVKLTKKHHLGHWLLFSLTLVLVGMTDYLPLFIIPVFFVYSLVNKKGISFISKLILSLLPLAAVFAVWSPTLITQINSGLSVAGSSAVWWRVLGKSSIKELALVPIKFMVGRITFDNKFVYALLVTFVGAIYGYLLVKTKQHLAKTSLVWLWLLLPIGLIFLVGFKVSVFSYFRLVFVLPALYLLLAFGLAKVKENVFPLVFMAILLVNITFSWMYLSNEKFHREDWRQAVSFVETDLSGKKGVVVFPGDSQHEAYLYYSQSDTIVKPNDITGQEEKVWLVRYVQDISDPADTTRVKIEDLGYTKSAEKNFNGIVVWEYTRK
ncbi:MAG: glycosyltransferase family 39 protein [Patescibacteria group bacterium]